MMRALCLIREALVYRRSTFIAGLRAAGYATVDKLNEPDANDVLVIWNRYGANDALASKFERVGARVVVVENGYLGKSWLGDRWFAMSLCQHAGGGKWTKATGDRWDRLNVSLAPWRDGGKESVILAQRGIGSPSVRSPNNWAQNVQARIGGRIRAHPGKDAPTVNLEDDLRDASCVVTWASTAALVALMLGVPVWYEYPHWIGGQAARPLADFGQEPKRSDEARLAMFRRLIWAMWRIDEIKDGTAFRTVLGSR